MNATRATGIPRLQPWGGSQEYAADFVEFNPEGTIVDQRVPFTGEAIGQLLESGRMAPAGGACLTLAWRHRDVLLG